MRFSVEIRFSDDIIMQANQLDQGDRVRYLEDKIEDGLEGGYYEHVEATYVGGGGKLVAQPNIVEKVYLAVEANNPNAPEDLDGEAIQELANYAEANDLIELHEDGDMIDQLLDPSRPECLAYFMYDMIKWTRANNA